MFSGRMNLKQMWTEKLCQSSSGSWSFCCTKLHNPLYLLDSENHNLMRCLHLSWWIQNLCKNSNKSMSIKLFHHTGILKSLNFRPVRHLLSSLINHLNELGHQDLYANKFPRLSSSLVILSSPSSWHQDGGCRGSEVRKEEVDSLLWECHLHHVSCGSEWVRPGPGGVGQWGKHSLIFLLVIKFLQWWCLKMWMFTQIHAKQKLQVFCFVL